MRVFSPCLACTIFSLLGVAMLAVPAAADPPPEILISGAVADSNGDPLSGIRQWQVTFYESETGGIPLASTQSGSVEISAEGLFNIALTPPAALMAETEVWYELGIDTDVPADSSPADDVFQQRVRLFSVPYALQAQDVLAVPASRVGAGSVDDNELDALDGVSANLQQQINGIDTSGIAANAAAIAQHDLDIQSNTAAIDGNQQDIQANAGAIVANTAAIALKADAADVYSKIEIDSQQAAQDSDIALKANAADVYSTAAADTAFVDAAGDTMSGALAVTDTTASTDKDTGALVIEGGAGIEGDLNAGGAISSGGNIRVSGASLIGGAPGGPFSIERPAAGPGQAGQVLRIEGQDGDAGQDGGSIVLSPGAGVGANPGGIIIADGFGTPSIMVDTLYNNGGNLFWNGVQLDADSIGKGDINNTGLLPFDWVDAEIADALTIQGGSVNNDSFSAFADLGAENKIGSAANQVAAGDHGHNLQDLSGSVTDGQVTNALTIQGGTVNNDSFSAYSDLGAEGVLNNDDDADIITRLQGDGRYAGIGHSHNLQDLGGSAGDAQVADNLTVQGGSVNNDSFSAVSDLAAEGLLDNNAGTDLLTRDQLDARFAPIGGGGAATEVWSTISGPGTLSELVLGTANHGANLKHNDAATRYGYFVNAPVTKTVTQVQVFVNRYEAWAGARTMTLTLEIRDIATGTLAHTVSTPINLTTATNVSWHTLTLDANAANRTITTSEYLAANFTLSGADGGAGEMEVRLLATVE